MRSSAEERKVDSRQRSRGDVRQPKGESRESERPFHSLVEHSTDIVAVLDEEGTVRYQSPSVKEVLGREVGALVGESVFDEVHPEDRASVRAEFEALLETPFSTRTVEFRMRHANGSWVHLEAVGRNLLDDSAVEGLLVSSRDITERVQTEEALRKRLELERTVARISEELLSDTADLDAVVAALGEAVGANRAHFFEFDRARQTLSNTHEWCAPGVASVLDERQGLKISDFSWWREEIRDREALRVRVPDLPPEARSEQRYFQAHGIRSFLDVPVRLSDGTFYGFIGFTSENTAPEWSEEDVRLLRVVSDLLARHFQRAEDKRALRASEERFRSVVENSQDVIFQTDAKGRWTLLSPSWEEVTGYTVEESLGNRYTDYMHPEKGRPESVEAYRERVVGEDGLAKDQARILTKEGEVRWLQVRSRLLYDSDGEVKGGVGTLTDVTEEVRFEAERTARRRAEQLLEAKTAFLNNMSHELRTPLASIIGFADVLAEEGEGMHKEFADRIVSSGERLQQTLNSVLSIAQLEGADTTEMELEPTDVIEAVREAAAVHRSAAQNEGLSFEVQVPKGGTDIRAPLNEGALQRILDNLLDNAVKFTEQGRITLAVDAGEHRVRIRVADTGVGIGAAFQEKLFEDFTQESSGLDRTHEGAGLGLTIVRRLTELMEGTIEVTSTKGEGSVFTVSFPRIAAREEADEEPVRNAGEAVPAPTPETTILLVEDNPNTRALTEHLLHPRYEVESVPNGEAMLRLKLRRFGVVLIDINLGAEEDGVELLHRLRSLPTGEGVPAVAFTAHAMPGDAERFLKAGFDDYLSKPFSKRELLDTIEAVLETERT